MWRISVLVCLIAAITGCHGNTQVLMYDFTPVFGDIDDPEVKQTYIDGCGENYFQSIYEHPKACNLYILCRSWYTLRTKFVNIAAFSCAEGTFFGPNGVCHPSAKYCKDGHPCDTPGKKLPQDHHSCGPYLQCVGNELERRDCGNGMGFNAYTGECDIPCGEGKEQVFFNETVCSTPLGEDGKKDFSRFRFNETVHRNYKNAFSTYFRITDRDCPPGTRHLVEDSCGCDTFKETTTVKQCTPDTIDEIVHLSSLNNTWTLALTNQLGDLKVSSIQGNASLVNDSNNSGNYPINSAFFYKTTFRAPKMMGNFLGNYFEMTFNFQSMRVIASSGNMVPGIEFPVDSLPHKDVALVDNSVCESRPTIGCKLTVTNEDAGFITCYVKPLDEKSAETEIQSQNLDLSRRIYVRFAKDRADGILSVRQEGATDWQTERVRFPSAFLVYGNKCALDIAAGNDKRFFTGFMDDLMVNRRCMAFLNPGGL